MFSSNQKLSISGKLKDLQAALEFTLNKYSDRSPIANSFQITENGWYVLGWAKEKKDYTDYPFKATAEILTTIITAWLKENACENDDPYWDGSEDDGFLLEVVEETFADEEDGVKEPFYAIVKIKPYLCLYSK